MVRMILVGAILVIGVAAFQILTMMRKAPDVEEVVPVTFSVRAIRVEPVDHQTTLSGFGTVRSARRAQISPEVTGRIVEVSAAFETGMLVRAGDLLVQVDPTDYEIRLNEAVAEHRRLEQELDALNTEERTTIERLELAEKSLASARREFDRIQQLVESDGESQSRLDSALAALLQSDDFRTQLASIIAQIPARRQQLEARLAAQSERIEQARINLERTRIVAPFDGRIDSKHAELGQTLQPGSPIATVSDVRTLEVSVPLESREVSEWLPVQGEASGLFWFEGLESIPVRVNWTESPDSVRAIGRLDRVEAYRAETRTFDVVVRLDAADNVDTLLGPGFPITEGMFCVAHIPGRTAQGVYLVPRESVDSANRILISEDGRLRTVTVRVLRREGDIAVVSEGLYDNAVVLVTRPPQVLEGMLIDVLLEEEAALEGANAP